jgi:hypothetical protein
VAIRASTSKTVDSLIADLSSDQTVTRESAIARLTIVGARAVDRLLALAANARASAVARAGALTALEGIGDPRALTPAINALDAGPGELGLAAVQVARAFLNSPRAVPALDALTAVALDRRRETALRLAAIQALSTLPKATLKPVMAALKDDPDPDVASALEPRRKAQAPASPSLSSAAEGKLPADAAALRRAIARAPKDTSPAEMQQVIEHLRVREGAEPAATRAGWNAARAAAHLYLAERGSRVAIYDLRETIESAKGPVAVEFVAALTAIGDLSCLEPIASAYARGSGAVSDELWRRHLAKAFAVIAKREGLTRKHAVARKIEKRWPKIIDTLLDADPGAWQLTPKD